MRKIVAGFCLSLLFLSAPILGHDPAKEIWQWTDEERLTERFDAASMRSRESAYLANKTGVPAMGRDVVRGETNPELFLPFELYQSLLRQAFSSSPEASQVFRDGFQERYGGKWFGDDFWRRLEQTARPYLESLKAQLALATEYQGARPGRRAEIDREADDSGTAACRLLAQNLEAARTAFGREAFDRFLYEAVAPGQFSVSVVGDVNADQIRFLAGGCR